MQKIEGRWLVAASTGSDSMALLKMCMECGMDIAVAHVNYHHRDASEEEERYIRFFTQENGIPLYVKNDPFVYRGNFEAEARKWRYDFFVQIVKEHGYKGVLIAHQRDDLLETYFMQKEKGVIVEWYGLKEDLLYQSVLVKRPLLSYTKKQLEEYCEQKHVRYYEDLTNYDESLSRNRIRHQIVEKLTPVETEMFLHEIERENAEMQERRCRVKTYIKEDGVSASFYRKLEKQDRETLLREMLLDRHMSLKRIDAIDHIILEKNDFVISLKEKDLVKDGDRFFLHEKSEKYCDVYERMEDLYPQKKKYYAIEKGSRGVYAVSLTEDDFPVRIRNYEPGDAIEMRFGKKKVNRFFIDRHIPLYKRKVWPLMTDRKGNVILLPGLGCDKFHFTVNPTCNVIE